MSRFTLFGVAFPILFLVLVCLVCKDRTRGIAMASVPQMSIWPNEIRMLGSSRVRLPIGSQVGWIRVTPSSDVAAAVCIYAVGPKGRARIDTPLGASVESLGQPMQVVIELEESKVKYSLDDIVTAHRSITISTRDKNTTIGSLADTEKILFTIQPNLNPELHVSGVQHHSSLFEVDLTLSDFLGNNVDDNGSQYILADASNINTHELRTFKVVPVSERKLKLLLPETYAQLPVTVHYRQQHWQQSYVKFKLIPNTLNVIETDNTVDHLDKIVLPKFRSWQRIGPFYPKGFEANRVDPHDTVGVYAQPKAVQFYNKTGYFPRQAVLVKVSRPIEIFDGDKAVGRLTQIETAKYIGGEKPDWVYAAAISKSDELKPGLVMHALPMANCYTCHYQKGLGNVFTIRYPVLRASKATSN